MGRSPCQCGSRCCTTSISVSAWMSPSGSTSHANVQSSWPIRKNLSPLCRRRTLHCPHRSEPAKAYMEISEKSGSLEQALADELSCRLTKRRVHAVHEANRLLGELVQVPERPLHRR